MKGIKKTIYILGILLATSNVTEAYAADKLKGGDDNSPSKIEEVTRRNRNCFKKGVQVITIGYGVPNLGKMAFKTLDRIHPTAEYGGIGPIHLKYEYAIGDKVGLGVSLRYLNSRIEYPVVGPNYDADNNPAAGDSTYIYTQTFSSIGAMVRANYHFSTGRQLDPYVGIGLGYGNTSFKLDRGGDVNGLAATISSPIPLAMEATIGARYYFSESIGVYAEVGFSQSIVNGGIAIKF